MTSDDDDGLACVELQVATRAHLVEEGFDFRFPFAIYIRRVDGEHFDTVSMRIENVAAMVAELTPPRFGLSVGTGEDYAALLAAIRGHGRESRGALH